MPSLRLHRDSGPQIELDRDRSVIGRDPACEVVVDDRSVSRRHAAIERRGDDWVVVDQGSANGTFVDGRRVPEAALRNGQQLRLGSVAFQVEIEEEAPATVLMSAPELEDATFVMTNPEVAPPEVAPPAPRAAPPPVVVPPPVVRPRSTPPQVPGVGVPVAPTPPPTASVSGDDALGLLGLGPGSSAEEVRARYEELARDLQVKLAGARSPNLKSTYERNLAELHKAFHRLSRGSQAFAGELADLPSAQPMVGPDLIEGSGVMKKPQPAEEEPLGEAAPAKGSSAILPGATTFLVFLAAALFSLVAFFALSAGKIEKAVKKAEEAPDLVNARQAAAKYAPAEALLKSGALRNGKLRLCNRASRALEIDWLSTVFLQKTDLPPGAEHELAALASGFKLGTYNSGFCGHDFKVVLAPGAEQAIELRSEDPRCNFDGLALFYALALQRPGEPEPAESEASAKGAGRHKARGVEPAPPEKRPGEPGTTFWQSGLLGGRNECVSVGAGW